MSPENMASKLVMKDDNQVSGNRKVLPEHAMKCPRCDSPNTKFCYYNNYSLSQPRHFCKTCRRYWTKGGALRNVPIGGGCRKSKKAKTPVRLAGNDVRDVNSSPGIGGLKLFDGLSPAMDFNLGNFYNHHLSGSSSNSLMGFNYSLPTGIYGGQFGSEIQTMNSNSLNVQPNLASSIESLSSINQDLHWKLQQQRQFNRVSSISGQKLQPIFFQNLDLSEPDQIKASGNGRKEDDTGKEWLFGNAYTAFNGGGAAIDDPASSTWNGIQAWNNHLSSYGGLP